MNFVTELIKDITFALSFNINEKPIRKLDAKPDEEEA